jgi:hypothetical protein
MLVRLPMIDAGNVAWDVGWSIYLHALLESGWCSDVPLPARQMAGGAAKNSSHELNIAVIHTLVGTDVLYSALPYQPASLVMLQVSAPLEADMLRLCRWAGAQNGVLGLCD